VPSNKVKRVPKPWGYEIWYAQAPKYVGKILVVNKGHRLSLQYHKKKHETVYVLKGRFVLELAGKKRIAKEGEAFQIPPKTIHRFDARFGRVTLLEASTPEVWDVVRLSDDYGRSK
jgi:mannose-6-phosphate isomerase